MPCGLCCDFQGTSRSTGLRNAESEDLNGTQPVLGVGRGVAGDRHHAGLARGSVANLRLCPALRLSQDAALVAHWLRSTPKAKAVPTAANAVPAISVGGGRAERYPLEGTEWM